MSPRHSVNKIIRKTISVFSGWFFLSCRKYIIPVPRPPKEDLLARHVSKFGKKIKQVKKIKIQKLNNPPTMPLAFTSLVLSFRNRQFKVF